MDFKTFCEKTAKFLGLELVPMIEGSKRAATYTATKTLPNPKYTVEFEDLSYNHPYFLGEIYGDFQGHRLCLGYIGLEEYNERTNIEHWECQVSPEGRYDEDFMPIDENGESVDGQLWVFYSGKSLKLACNSILKGGSLENPKRKPKIVY